MTKRQLVAAYSRYTRIKQQTIYNVYANPSAAKINAYYYCMRHQKDHAGVNGKVVAHNCMTFTFGYTNDKGFWYITKCNDYFISWEDIHNYEETV